MPGYGSQAAARHQDGHPAEVSADRNIDGQNLENPRILLERLADGGDPDDLIAALVDRLVRPGYAISDLLGDVMRLKEELAIRPVTPQWLIDAWRRLDHAVAECLARTTVS